MFYFVIASFFLGTRTCNLIQIVFFEKAKGKMKVGVILTRKGQLKYA